MKQGGYLYDKKRRILKKNKRVLWSRFNKSNYRNSKVWKINFAKTDDRDNNDELDDFNFEDIDMSFIKNDMDLNTYIKKQMTKKEKYYLFFDEIQNVVNWEKAINSFKATKNVSIFIFPFFLFFFKFCF